MQWIGIFYGYIFFVKSARWGFQNAVIESRKNSALLFKLVLALGDVIRRMSGCTNRWFSQCTYCYASNVEMIVQNLSAFDQFVLVSTTPPVHFINNFLLLH